tara:strand:- start:132 stop:692 length:561 start_codon:yes stop_codon:yes gene_type:complete
MKLTNIYESLLNEQLDCSNLFTDSADGTHHEIAVSNDLYYYVVKLISVKRKLMSPHEFFDELDGFESHDTKDFGLDWVDVDKKVETMKSGVKLDMPYLNYERYGTAHEGRHRTAAAMKMGCKLIPVMVEKPVRESDVMALANKVGDLEQGEMIIELKKLGFKHFQNIDHVARALKMSKVYGEYYGG